MKRGEVAVPSAPPGAHPDLSGLSCRYELIPSQRGQIPFCSLSCPDRCVARTSAPSSKAITRIVEKTPDASRPLTGAGLRLRWPPQGYDLEARASRRASESIGARKVKVLATDLSLFPHHAARRARLSAKLSPANAASRRVAREIQTAQGSSDLLQHGAPTAPQLIAEIETYLKTAAAKGAARCACINRDLGAMLALTSTPSPTNPKHVRFSAPMVRRAATRFAAAALRKAARVRGGLKPRRRRASHFQTSVLPSDQMAPGARCASTR